MACDQALLILLEDAIVEALNQDQAWRGLARPVPVPGTEALGPASHPMMMERGPVEPRLIAHLAVRAILDRLEGLDEQLGREN